jgi:hypothetical protein
VTAVSCISPGRQRSLTSNSNIPLEKGRVAGVLVILQKKNLKNVDCCHQYFWSQSEYLRNVALFKPMHY